MPRTATIALRTFALALPIAALLTACSPPEPPQEERRPEPQASAAELPKDGSKPTVIQETYGPAIEKAKSAEDQTLEAARQQQAAIDAQTQ